jgi:hypothetical protein
MEAREAEVNYELEDKSHLISVALSYVFAIGK